MKKIKMLGALTVLLMLLSPGTALARGGGHGGGHGGHASHGSRSSAHNSGKSSSHNSSKSSSKSNSTSKSSGGFNWFKSAKPKSTQPNAIVPSTPIETWKSAIPRNDYVAPTTPKSSYTTPSESNLYNFIYPTTTQRLLFMPHHSYYYNNTTTQEDDSSNDSESIVLIVVLVLVVAVIAAGIKILLW